MNRRGFFGLFAAAAVTAIALPELELLMPTRTIFLPPAGGWIGRGNQLLTIKMIAEEALRLMHQHMEFMTEISRAYDPSFAQRDLFVQRDGSVSIHRPPRYDVRVDHGPLLYASREIKWPS